MPGKVIGIAPNICYPGTFSRNGACYVKARKVKTSAPYFGDPVYLDTDNTVIKAGVSFTMARFCGFAVREVKQFIASYDPAQTAGLYAVGDIADILEQGDICVHVTRGNVTAGGAVYVRTVLGMSPDTNAVVGGIEATTPSDGGTSIQLTNCAFSTGVQDANGVAEVSVLTRNQS